MMRIVATLKAARCNRQLLLSQRQLLLCSSSSFQWGLRPYPHIMLSRSLRLMPWDFSPGRRPAS